jgi:hypothetical protein
LAIATRAGSGLFTSTDPEKRRIKPENPGTRVQVKLVYVVLEAQYQSAVAAAVKQINAKNQKVRFDGPDMLAWNSCHAPCMLPMLARFALCSLICLLLTVPAQVCFEVVGYLLEELRDNKNFEAFKQDVATANIFIGSLIFIEELADKVCMRRIACCCIALNSNKGIAPASAQHAHSGLHAVGACAQPAHELQPCTARTTQHAPSTRTRT